MARQISRRRFLGATLGASVAGVAGCLTTTNEGYEVWTLDQGTNTIYVHEAFSEPDEDVVEFEQQGSIDTEEQDGQRPHSIHFSEGYTHAAVTFPASGRTVLYGTGDREPVANLETGPGSHYAGFTPADDTLLVDVIGESKIVRVDLNFEESSFGIRDELAIDGDVDGLTAESGAPVSHSHTGEGRSIHTLGPRYEDGGAVVVDMEEFTVETTFTGGELPTNNRAIPHPTAEKFYLTAGTGPGNGEEGIGSYYVLDTEANEIRTQGDTRGVDADGLWFGPDGEELWILNRGTNDGVVVDPETDEIVEEIEEIGPGNSETEAVPNAVWFSPDGEYVFVSLSGPVAPPDVPEAVPGVTPGVAVLEAETRERVDIIEPNPIGEFEDEEIASARDADSPEIPYIHGIGVRPLDDFEGQNSPPY